MTDCQTLLLNNYFWPKLEPGHTARYLTPYSWSYYSVTAERPMKSQADLVKLFSRAVCYSGEISPARFNSWAGKLSFHKKHGAIQPHSCKLSLFLATQQQQMALWLHIGKCHCRHGIRRPALEY